LHIEEKKRKRVLQLEKYGGIVNTTYMLQEKRHAGKRNRRSKDSIKIIQEGGSDMYQAMTANTHRHHHLHHHSFMHL